MARAIWDLKPKSSTSLSAVLGTPMANPFSGLFHLLEAACNLGHRPFPPVSPHWLGIFLTVRLSNSSHHYCSHGKFRHFPGHAQSSGWSRILLERRLLPWPPSAIQPTQQQVWKLGCRYAKRSSLYPSQPISECLWHVWTTLRFP